MKAHILFWLTVFILPAGSLWAEYEDLQKAFQEAGMNLSVRKEKDGTVTSRLSAKNEPVKPEVLSRLPEIPNLIHFQIWAGINSIKPEHLKGLERQTGLKTLVIQAGHFDNSVMPYISNHREVEKFILMNTRITDEGLEQLPVMPKVEQFSHGFHRLSRRAMQLIAIKFPNVKKLDFSHAFGMDAANLPELAPLQKLEELLLSGGKINDGNIHGVLELKNIRNLVLYHAFKLGDNAIETVAKHEGIENLFIGNHRISDEGIRHLAKMKNLKSLKLGKDKGKMTDEALKIISQMPLQKLDIEYKQFTDEGFSHRPELGLLTHLGLGGRDCTDLTLSYVAKIPRLEELVIGSYSGSPPFTDKGLEHLKGCKNLRQITIRRTVEGFTKAGITELKKSLPNTRVIDQVKR